MGETKDAIAAMRRDIAQTYVGADEMTDRLNVAMTGQTRAETLAEMRRLSTVSPPRVGAAIACAESAKGGENG